MAPQKKFRIVPLLLVLLPLWLIGSGAFALVKYFSQEKAELEETGKRFSRSVSTEDLADDLKKIITLVGERNTTKPAKLAATASMIQGLLGPANTGYKIGHIDSPSDFPIIHVSVPAKKSGNPPVWVLSSYDSPVGSRGAEKNATGLTAALAAARALADEKPAHDIHFVFLPHSNEADSPVIETAAAVREFIARAPSPQALLCIEAMGDSESLILTSRDTEAIPTTEFAGLGKVLGAEVICLGDDFDLASTLFEMNLPAIRIATRPTLLPDENDEQLPFAPTLAASTGRLIELIRRLSN
ncbi:M28 family peptidase [Luteolibacter algae]|uniref:M28 family peptidase n=1 Tax=Luteolibacter algae TaxID=454151 RepID=A0ABW5D738_9BACT